MFRWLRQLGSPRPRDREITVAALDAGCGDFGLEIVGESHYQAALRHAIVDAGIQDESEKVIRVLVMREPTNRFDPNAVRVVNMRGETIGHLSELDAEDYADVIERCEATKRFVACKARLYGGTKGKPSIGAWLDLMDSEDLEDLLD